MKKRLNARVEIRTSPHIHYAPSVSQIMRNVVYALVPISLFGIYQFGLSALALIVVTTASCLATEHLFMRVSDRASSLHDFSAVITGLLLALTLPPGFPLWMAAVAGFIAIALGKVIFGGLGYNILNPALVGRAFVQAAFPVAITTWTPAFIPGRFNEFVPSTLTLPFLKPISPAEWINANAIDGFTGATPLALQKFEQIQTSTIDLLMGMTSGSAGESSALLIMACGLYLAFRKMLDWRIPVGILVSSALFSALFYLINPDLYPPPLFTLLSCGMMLGAIFMATDMVASPLTPLGVWSYAILIGVLTVTIRFFGGLPEGIMYAILLGNAASPLIASLTQPRAYGKDRRSLFNRRQKEES